MILFIYLVNEHPVRMTFGAFNGFVMFMAFYFFIVNHPYDVAYLLSTHMLLVCAFVTFHKFFVFFSTLFGE